MAIGLFKAKITKKILRPKSLFFLILLVIVDKQLSLTRFLFIINKIFIAIKIAKANRPIF